MKVKAKITTIHPKYGQVNEGDVIDIEERDFGEEIFEKMGIRPDSFGMKKKKEE
ncbi:MAG: hypothetical protein HY805_00315 [Nitrospirae bacterium]|nr:hypothetical protein [Nitrospirota bacterium]